MKRKGLLLASMCAALTLTGLSACGNNSTPVKTFFDVTVSDDRTILAVGETVQLNVTIYGTTSDEVTYTSDNEKVLSVSESGLCTAIKSGSATVTVASVSNPELTKEIKLDVTLSLGQRNPQLQEMADSISSYDYEKGVKYNADISVDVGVGEVMGLVKLSDLHLPLEAEVQKTKDETNVHIRADVEEVLHQEGMTSMVNVPAILKKTLGALLHKDFDSYLRDDECKDFKYLDLYAFNSFDYYVAQTRNFGTEEDPEYRPFSIGKGNAVSLLSPIASTLLGGILGGSGDEAPQEGGLDIGSLLSKEGLLRLTSTLYGFFDEDTGADYTKLSLGQEALNLINPMLADVGGYLDINLGGIAVEGWYLPTKLTDVSITVNNKAAGENKFSGLELSVKGINPLEEEYEFINISLDQPEILSADYMSGEKEKILAYNAANTTPILYGKEGTTTTLLDATKQANKLLDMESEFNVAETKAITDQMNKLISLYENATDPYVKDLLYPLSLKISKSKYGEERYIKAFIDSKTITNEKDGKIIVDHYLNKEKVETKAEFTSDKPEIISVDKDGNVKGVAKLFNGSIGAENTKNTDNSSTLTAKLNYKDGEEDVNKSIKIYSVKYEGDKVAFPKTKSTLNKVSNFDEATHDLSIASNATFDLKTLVKLPDGATDAKYTWTSKDKKIAEVDKDGKLTTITSYLENDNGSVRNIAGITLKLTYKLGTETITDNHIFYAKLTDDARGKIDTSKLTDKVKFDEKTSTITATSEQDFKLEDLFIPSASKVDEGSLTVKFNKMNSSLYEKGEIKSPYFSNQILDENGKLGVTDKVSGKESYVEVTYKVDGVTKIERTYFTFLVTGEPKQQDSTVFDALNDPHYNKETNTFTFNADEFKTIELNGTKIDSAYDIVLNENWILSSVSTGNKDVITSKSYRDDKKQFCYVLVSVNKGKTGICLTFKNGTKNYKLYSYIEIK